MIATANLGELLDTAALLASQPVPAGNRVGVVSNTRGAAVLAADACGDAGLQVASLARDTQQALRDLLARRCRGGRAGRYHRAGHPRPLPPLPGTGRRRPGRGRGAGADDHHRGRRPGPRGAAPRGCRCRSPRAYWTRLKWSGCCPARARTPPPFPPTPTPSPPPAPSATPRATASGGPPRRDRYPISDGLRPDRARELVAGFLADAPKGGWLSLDQTVELLGCYGVRLVDRIAVSTEDAAAAAAARFGGPGGAQGGPARRDAPARCRRVLLDLHVRRGGPARVPLAAGELRRPADRRHCPADDHRRRRGEDQRPSGARCSARWCCSGPAAGRRRAGRPRRPARPAHRLRRRRPHPLGTRRPAAARAATAPPPPTLPR